MAEANKYSIAGWHAHSAVEEADQLKEKNDGMNAKKKKTVRLPKLTKSTVEAAEAWRAKIKWCAFRDSGGNEQAAVRLAKRYLRVDKASYENFMKVMIQKVARETIRKVESERALEKLFGFDKGHEV